MQISQSRFEREYYSDPALKFKNNMIKNSIRRTEKMLEIIEEGRVPDTIIQCPECKYRSLRHPDNKPRTCPICGIKMTNRTPFKNILYRLHYYWRDLIRRLRNL